MKSQSKAQASRDNHANQCNPTHPAYYLSRGESDAEAQAHAREAHEQAREAAASVAPLSDDEQ